MSWRSQVCGKVVMNLDTLSFGHLTRFKTVVSVCGYVFCVNLMMPTTQVMVMNNF